VSLATFLDALRLPAVARPVAQSLPAGFSGWTLWPVSSSAAALGRCHPYLESTVNDLIGQAHAEESITVAQAHAERSFTAARAHSWRACYLAMAYWGRRERCAPIYAEALADLWPAKDREDEDPEKLEAAYSQCLALLWWALVTA